MLALGSVTITDAERGLRIYERKRLTRAQFLSAIAVRVKPLTAFMSSDAIDAISGSAPRRSSLTVKRKKAVEASLAIAVQ